MLVKECDIPGLLEFVPTPHVDDRGFFTRTFDRDVIEAAGISADRFVQDSLSRSRRGVLRGLHLRTGLGESKLVRCSYGAVFDVVVDLRLGSPTYRHWRSFALDGEAQSTLYVPAGCAHGFQALTETADTSYRIDRPHDPREDLTISYRDPELGIGWPLARPVTSAADRDARPLSLLSEELLAAPEFG